MSRFKTRLLLSWLLIMLISSSLAMAVSHILSWLILKFSNASSLQAAIMSVTLRQVLTLAYSLGIASMMIFFAARRTSRPIERLSKATQEVINGNFDIHVPESDRHDEVSNLERNFNKMTKELKGNLYLRKDFINSISHEFKTPLAAISAYSKLLAAESIGDEERLEYANVILQESKRLTSLTTSILRLSKLDNQTIPENAKNYSLDEQIRQVVMLLEPNWGRKNIEMDIDMDECRIFSEEELLRQVWQNLLDNAIKFTGDGGTISISLRKTDGVITVVIADSGVGMSDETMGRIFDQFYQGDTLDFGQGNGLGLTIVKKILDICGGSISVKSEKGKGSSFCVTLPSR